MSDGDNPAGRLDCVRGLDFSQVCGVVFCAVFQRHKTSQVASPRSPVGAANPLQVTRRLRVFAGPYAARKSGRDGVAGRDAGKNRIPSGGHVMLAVVGVFSRLYLLPGLHQVRTSIVHRSGAGLRA